MKAVEEGALAVVVATAAVEVEAVGLATREVREPDSTAAYRVV